MLLSVCFASNVYEVGNDVELDSMIYWPSDYKISMLAFDDADSTMLEWIYDMLTDIWNDMRAGFEFVDEDIVAGNTLLSQINVSNTSIYNLLDGMDSTLDYVLQGVGQTNGYLQITNNKLDDVNSAVGLVNGSVSSLQTDLLNTLRLPSGSTYLNSSGNNAVSSSVFNNSTFLNTAFRGIASLLRVESGDTVLLSSGASGTMGSFAGIDYVLRHGFLGLASLFRSEVGDSVLLSSGVTGTLSGYAGVEYVLRNGLLGLSTHMTLPKDTSVLLPSGVAGVTTGVYGIDGVLQGGFLGLRSLISGSESDNVYSGTSINNSNESTSFSATGLGPMLNTWLGDIQNDLGLLSYVFASPQDLELKEDSSDNMSAIGDSLLSPDSASSVKVSDIAGISEASTAIKGFGDTGVSIGQAFAQLGDASLFRFFSAEAASDLDTSVSTYSRNVSDRIVTNYYADSRDEFYSIINGGEG